MISIEDCATKDTIATNIKSLREYYEERQQNISFVIYEGSLDSRVYSRMLDKSKCFGISARGKDMALSALEILEAENIQGIFSIVDLDFELCGITSYSSQNVILTDFHDLEVMLLMSTSLDKVLDEYGSKLKIELFEKDMKQTVINQLLTLGLPLGYLRFISLRNQINLNFDGIIYSKFIDRSKFSINIKQLVKVVKDKSNMHKLDENGLCSEISALIEQKLYSPLHVCCGHDLVSILSIGLQSILGSNSSGIVAPEMLEKALRIGYESTDFHQTNLYKKVLAWELLNFPFAVF
jgi:hypothetical protein